ncbi:Malic enzyme, NAD-binding [Artemisia annua]|uniref:Malic enzyme, NAD-binding n=1 Tax=Artemisia annua TaxID=35608 RepID=A0A2U1KNW1_ARTAN|nr:Malic enzyme, NAD-binding [Artemisia annua]
MPDLALFGLNPQSGRCIFSSGYPFDPYEYKGKLHIPGQANNAYIFPGLVFGLVISGAIRVHDEMLLAASKALANQVTQEHYHKGMIYPPLTNIRKISANIAAHVAAKAYDLGELLILIDKCCSELSSGCGKESLGTWYDSCEKLRVATPGDA